MRRALTPREVPQTRGFEVYPGIVSDDERAALLAALELVPRTRAGSRHVLSDPAVSDLAADARLTDIARSFLGAAPIPFRATLFDKSAGSNWLVAWHQDTALPFTRRFEEPGWGPWSTKAGVLYAHAPAWAMSRVIALRVHLDPSDASNGPLRVIAGSHELGVLTDAQLGDLAKTRAALECAVPAGGILAVRPLLVHSSSKSVSPSPRRVIHIEYADSRMLVPGSELAVA
jgi:ectoine hydroxylase-related dioxygenase (phytanoyl-CoA dioxygenase family)